MTDDGSAQGSSRTVKELTIARFTVRLRMSPMEQVFDNDDSLPEQRQEAAKKTTWVSMVVNV